MGEFKRANPLFSLCGLNCGLCTMRIGGHCPSCGQGNRPCKVARCAVARGVEYCFECPEYPCQLYDHADVRDSFITHLNQKADMQKARRHDGYGREFYGCTNYLDYCTYTQGLEYTSEGYRGQARYHGFDEHVTRCRARPAPPRRESGTRAARLASRRGTRP